MDLITFKNYEFYYDSNISECIIDDNNLILLNDDEVRIHISLQDKKLMLRPRLGVTIQRLSDKRYQILTN